MSLFDTLLGSSSSGDTNNQSKSNQTQVEQKNTTQNTSAVTNTNQQQASTGTNTTNSSTAQKNQSTATGQQNSLNQGVVDTVSGLITQLAGGKGQVSDIVSSLLQKANTPAISDADIKAQGDAAKLAFSQGEAVDIGQAQNRIGSKMNTYSELLDQKGQQDLATTLAGIMAQAKSTNAQISTQQLIAALEGTGQQSGQVAQLVSALKGANVSNTQSITGSTTQDTQAQTIQQLLDIITGNNTAVQSSVTDENTAAQASGSSTSNTQGSQGSGLLGLLF